MVERPDEISIPVGGLLCSFSTKVAKRSLFEDPQIFLCRCTCGMAFLCHHSCSLPFINFRQMSRLVIRDGQRSLLVRASQISSHKKIKLLACSSLLAIIGAGERPQAEMRKSPCATLCFYLRPMEHVGSEGLESALQILTTGRWHFQRSWQR